MKRYCIILKANESEKLFQGIISFYAKIEQMIANTPPYSAMDIQCDTLRTIFNKHSWAFMEDQFENDDTEEHYRFYVLEGSDEIDELELLWK